MFVVNDDLSIYATRGDTVFFIVTAEEHEESYIFKAGEVVRIKIYEKKNCENVVLQKDFPVIQDSQAVQIILTEAETKFGEVISKPTDYWYEIELNPYNNPQTIVGYDEDGAKVFRLFPEGNDVPEFVPDPEDIRVMDTELDMTSTRPVQNQAIARAMTILKGDFSKVRTEIIEQCEDIADATEKVSADLAVERARIDNLIATAAMPSSGDEAYSLELADVRVGADGTTYGSAGTAVREQIGKITAQDEQYEGFKNIVWTYGYLRSNGKVIDAETSDRMKSDYILCGEGVEVEYYGETNHANVFGIAFYDANKNIISGISNDRAPSAATVTSPLGTRYVRVSTQASYLDKSFVRFSYEVYNRNIEDTASKVNTLSADVGLLKGESVRIPLKFTHGGISTEGELVDSSYRMTTQLLYVDGRYTVKCLDSKYRFTLYNRLPDSSIESFKLWVSEFTFVRTGYIEILVEKADESELTVSDVRAIADSITLVKHASHANKGQETEVFVSSVNGDDTSDGSFANPFKTVQFAIDSGFRRICLLPGKYEQSVHATGINDLSIYAYNGESYVEGEHRDRPVFTNGKLYDELVSNSDGTKSFKPSAIPERYTQVFVDKTLAPVADGTRPSYNASLWANHANKYDDYKLKPVLTQAELLAEEGTFYLNGSTVYVNTKSDKDVIGYTVVGDQQKYLLLFEQCNGLKLSGIKAMHGNNTNFRVYKCNGVTIDNCESAYTMYGNGFEGDYSDITYNNCLSYKARNDGFNTHYYGISVFNNCRGVHNYDDGESSHDYCEVIVNGGEYAHNGKGGHSPVNGCKFTCNNSYAHGNNYGFYMIADRSFDLTAATILLNGCVSINNKIADIRVAVYDVVALNTHYATTNIESGSFADPMKNAQ